MQSEKPIFKKPYEIINSYEIPNGLKEFFKLFATLVGNK